MSNHHTDFNYLKSQCTSTRSPSITRSSRDQFVSKLQYLPPENSNLEQFELVEEVLTVEDFSENGCILQPPKLQSNGNQHTDSVTKKNGVASIQANNNGSTKCIENDTDPKIASGLRYIKKLDRIIEQKNKKEKEIKCERQAIQKEFCLQIQKMIEEKGLVNFYGSQQLLALCMYDKNCDGYEDDVETVFTTQISSKFYDEKTLLNLNIEDTPASKSKQFNTSKNKNFIKRNIQLAAHANEVVSLTDKEQERLDELLTDSNDLLLMNNPFSAPTISYDGGYNYSAEDQLALDIIDAKLMGMLPPGDFDVHPKIYSCDVTLAKNKLDAATNKVGDTATFDILECGDNVLQKDHDNQFLKYRLKDIETQLENLKLTDKADKEAQIHPNLIRYLLNTEKKSVDNSI